MNTCRKGKTVLEVKNLTKFYRQSDSSFNLRQIFTTTDVSETKNLVFKDVTFSVVQGQTVGLVGLNGAGKSTLLKILAGIIPPTFGEVSCNVKYASIIELGAGFDSEFTGIENLRISGLLNGVSEGQLSEFVLNASSFSELGEKLQEPIKSYSSGMVARLAFSILPFLNCELLLVDEALSVGDFVFQQKCFGFFREFKKNGGSLVLVSHDIGLVQEICEKGLLLWRDDTTGKSDFLYGDVRAITREYIRVSEKPKSTRRFEEVNRNSEIAELIEQTVCINCEVTNLSIEDQPLNPSISFNSAEAIVTSIQEKGEQNLAKINFEAQTSDRVTSSVMFGFQITNKKGTIVLAHDSELAILFQENEVKRCYFEFELPTFMDGEYALSLFASKGERFDNLICGSVINFAALRISANQNAQGIFSLKKLTFGHEKVVRSE